MFESILCQVTEYDPDVLESLIELAVEIAREGREGRRVGTLFTLGDRPPAWQREEGTSRRTDDSDTKSATSLDREASMTDHRCTE
jgi:DNA integrity scanning protein DisA with diadenylate cyclase activity